MTSHADSRARAIGVYIHIPFCRTLCPYCDFVRTQCTAEAPDSYIHALYREIAAFDGPGRADTIFLGGGTPSLLTPAQLRRVLDAVRERFDVVDGAEVSLEANPDDVTEALADAWVEAGVNRISLGVQRFSDPELRYLGRRHDAATAHRACDIVAERFANWSMDLMFGASPMPAWRETLQACAAHDPPHVSTYGMAFEPGTPFGQRASDAVDEETYLREFWFMEEPPPARSILNRDSHRLLTRYEVSNHARPGFECRHNLRYWRNLEYAGFGLGTYQYVDGVRASNGTDLADYLAHPGRKAEELRLTEREIRIETIIQHFRLWEGITNAAYRARFGLELRDDFGCELDALEARGLIQKTKEGYRPTRLGFELNNEIGLVFVG